LLLAGLLAGLFLYLIDLPARFRMLKEGDPPGYSVPADAVGQILGKESTSERNLQLYWFLSDRYLPEEYHKRLYLAGALFKIFVDTRVLLILASMVLCVVGWIVGPGSAEVARDSVCLDVPCILRPFALPTLMAGIGMFGVLTYRLNVFEKRQERPSTWIPRELAEIQGVLIALAGLGVIGMFLVISSSWLAWLGCGLALIGFATWVAMEIGPPSESAEMQSLRSSYLLKLRATHKGTQFSQFQRLCCDIALLWPWSMLALVSALKIDVAYLLIAVAVMGGLATTILSIRKHESRFLTFYKEQAVWFQLHKSDLLTISETQELPDHWD
jgi:hypothetical protein